MRRFWGDWPRWLVGLIPFVLTFALYGRVLSLPLYWDDAPQYIFVVPNTLRQIWTNQTGYAYYRPLIFTFYKFAFQVFVPNFIFLCYGVGLIIHALNGVLVGKLASVLMGAAHGSSVTPRAVPLFAKLAGPLASLLFVVYPFTIYIVGNFAALAHSVVILLTLAGMLAVARFVRTPSKRWLVVMLVATALAPYFHESGVMVSAILMWAMLCLNAGTLRRRPWLPVVLFLLSAAFLVVWSIVPKTRDAFLWPGPKMIFDNATFFLQGLTFPVQPLATLLINRFKWNDVATIWLVGLPALLGLAAIFWRARQKRLYWLLIGWSLLAILPSILALQFWYIATSPRLLYGLAPAVSLVWTMGCLMAIASLRRKWTRVLVGGGVALLILVPALYFTFGKVHLYRLSLNPIKQLGEWARVYPRDRHLIINPPDWVADIKDFYPMGRWGVAIMPDYVQLSHLALINSGLTVSFDSVHFPPVQEAMATHYYQIAGPELDWSGLAARVPDYDRVWLTTYSDERIALEEAGAVREGPATVPSAYRANFDGQVFLLAGHFAVEGQAAVVTLDWKYVGPDPNATIFRHVTDCGGKVLGMGDGALLSRTVQFSDLVPGAEVRDVRRIPLEALSADGCYALEVGLFRGDGSRVTALSPDGKAFENAVVTFR